MPAKPPEDVTVTVSGVPADLLKEIDAAARADGRNRSSYIRRELERLVRETKRLKAKAA